mmetsp:Transcript_11690/g.29350  ORF Transcript_11690/g.29350 Transcript_11690/m.29350 type:complete len:213 (+) Transcript_11690:367-1005(+)
MRLPSARSSMSALPPILMPSPLSSSSATSSSSGKYAPSRAKSMPFKTFSSSAFGMRSSTDKQFTSSMTVARRTTFKGTANLFSSAVPFRLKLGRSLSAMVAISAENPPPSIWPNLCIFCRGDSGSDTRSLSLPSDISDTEPDSELSSLLGCPCLSGFLATCLASCLPDSLLLFFSMSDPAKAATEEEALSIKLPPHLGFFTSRVRAPSLCRR